MQKYISECVYKNIEWMESQNLGLIKRPKKKKMTWGSH